MPLRGVYSRKFGKISVNFQLWGPIYIWHGEVEFHFSLPSALLYIWFWWTDSSSFHQVHVIQQSADVILLLVFFFALNAAICLFLL